LTELLCQLQVGDGGKPGNFAHNDGSLNAVYIRYSSLHRRRGFQSFQLSSNIKNCKELQCLVKLDSPVFSTRLINWSDWGFTALSAR